MKGSMDLTVETDVIEDATFRSTGTHILSFIVDDEILGEIEVPVYVQQAPTKLPKETEDGLKKSDVIWVGDDRGGKRRAAPAWFAYKNGRILVLSQREPGPQEQTIPGLPAAHELLVTTQMMTESLKETARKEADLILREAEMKAEDLLKSAHVDFRTLQRDLLDLRKERVLALEKLRSMLQSFAKVIELEEMDVNSMMGEGSLKNIAGGR